MQQSTSIEYAWYIPKGEITKELLVSEIVLALALPFFAAGAKKGTIEKYPSWNVRVIIPWSVGGMTGVLTRPVASHPEKQFGVPFVVENKHGADGVAGSLEIEKDANDGYVIGTTSMSTVSAKYASPIYPDIHNVELITIPATVTVNAKSPFKTLQDLIDCAKANPDKLATPNSGKRKELPGPGIIEGVAAPESANYACTGGAVTTVLMGGLIIQGLRPGPLLFQQQMPFVSFIFISLMLSVAFICILGLVGSYAISNSIFDIWVLIISGIVGFFLRKIGLSIAPIILGIIPGPLLESNFRRALMLYGGSWATFVQSPISLAFLLIVVVVLAGPAILKKFNKTLIRGT